jgi:hypothetical protein
MACATAHPSISRRRFSNKMTNFSQECRMDGESVTKLRK